MYRLIALLLLAGCVAKTPSPIVGFRDPAKQIYSNAVLENDRLVGMWRQVGEFAAPDAPACPRGGLEIAPAQGGLAITGQLCLGGANRDISGRFAATGPGRFTPQTGEAWWVLWADVGYRTLVIGTPSGRFGFILDRSDGVPADRLRAAREVLDWNGYSLARLR